MPSSLRVRPPIDCGTLALPLPLLLPLPLPLRLPLPLPLPSLLPRFCVRSLMPAAVTSCEPGQLWLSMFVVTGVALGLILEALKLHAGPASPASFLVPFFGYVGQLVVSGTWVVANHSGQHGRWKRRTLAFLMASSLGNGAAQALDYTAFYQAGILLYTILHSSVTLFACIISVVVLRTSVTPVQWLACASVVAGLVLTAVPSPIEIHGQFVVGVICAAAGSLCLASSYPFAELVFRSSAAGPTPPTEEMCSLLGSLVNVGIFGIWTVAYTMPRWDELVLQPIRTSKSPSPEAAVAGLYLLYALMVGVHTLAFWKTMRTLGTVPTAISRGAQQAGTFLLAHVFFCSEVKTQCLTNDHGGSHDSVWSRAQKPVAFVLCCAGCFIYAVVKKRPIYATGAHPVPEPVEVAAPHR